MAKIYDPHMHTAEHILNQTMDRMFSCGRDFRAHIETKKSKCDYHFERELSADEIVEIQERVNGVIRSDLHVEESFMTRAEANAMYNTSKLPDNTGDEIRIIRIGDYDVCPCIGPHVASTQELGMFVISSSDYTDGVLRIRFKLYR